MWGPASTDGVNLKSFLVVSILLQFLPYHRAPHMLRWQTDIFIIAPMIKMSLREGTKGTAKSSTSLTHCRHSCRKVFQNSSRGWATASHKTRAATGTAVGLGGTSKSPKQPQMPDPKGQSRGTLAGQRTRVRSSCCYSEDLGQQHRRPGTLPQHCGLEGIQWGG